MEPQHTYVLELLQSTYLKLQDWESLRALLPELRKRKVMKPDVLDALEQKVHLQLIQVATKSSVTNAVNKAWERIPKSLYTDPELLLNYTNYLLSHNDSAKAETLLRDSLRKHWDIRLVKQYGSLNKRFCMKLVPY